RIKFSYILDVRRKPIGLPVVTIMPSRAKKVSGAQLTCSQPVRSLPLKSGTKPSSPARAELAPMNTTRTTKQRFMGMLLNKKSIRRLSSFFLLAQLREHAEIFQSGCVLCRRLAAGDVAKQAAHNLAGPCLGQGVCEANVVGTGQGADFLDDVLLEFGLQL